MESFIQISEKETDRPFWILRTEHTAYVLEVDAQGWVQHVYWGPRLLLDSDYRVAVASGPRVWERPTGISREEFPAWGDPKYGEPCLKATFADRTRAVVLQYTGYEITTEDDLPVLLVRLTDPHYGLEVHLHYRVIPEFDLIERKAIIVNGGDQSVMLEHILSAAWNFPLREGYRLKTLGGMWGSEFQIQDIELPIGQQVMESRRGHTSHHANPWFGLDCGATETHGEVWFGALAYSGSWKFTAERNAYGRVVVTGGVNDFDFTWKLDAGESFETPVFVGGFSAAGYGPASRSLHGYERAYVLPNAKPRPVLYNSWYVTTFDVNFENQRDVAAVAAEMGVEYFVIDDGWFGKRKNDYAGLGDWTVDRDKFPDGLNPLIDYVHDLGMQFGLWVEPEMINPDSDLYRAHPDWVFYFPNRPRTELRHQLVLNMAREDVREHIFKALDDLLTEYDIRFVKWDHNRSYSEVGWPEAPEGRDREIWVRHIRGVYDIFRKLRANHPDVIFESCAGGGGRVDLGIMRYTEQFWGSDNTDSSDNLLMFEGFSMAYAPLTKMSWVTEPDHFSGQRPTPLAHRFLAGMLGSLGVGAELTKWTPEQRAEGQRWISLYKDIRETVQLGDLYRLRSTRNGPLAAFQFVHPTGQESVVFAFLDLAHFGPYRACLLLQGLDPQARYRIDGQDTVMSGAALMQGGVQITLNGVFASQIIRIRRED
ncbi:MAG: alpha-galactosidase [Anaerolineae bacterium]|nr:alpha-galactosidase [Anaerolineae bacterium]